MKGGTAAADLELRLQQGRELVGQLEELRFHDAAKMLRIEMKQLRNETRLQLQRRIAKKASSRRGSDNGSNNSDDEATESSTDSSSSEEESDASESETESSVEESSASEDDSEVSEPDKPPKQPMLSFSRSVSFSDDDNVVFVVSPKARRPKSMFYSKQDIARFRLEDRMEKSQIAQAQLEELISAAKSTMGMP